jgi:phosphatidylglycerophosphatase A
MSSTIATVFGIGYLRPAPGTWGSLFAVILAILLVEIFGIVAFVSALLFMCVFGWWATHNYLKQSQSKDPSEVVIDELIGQWIASLPVAFAVFHLNLGSLELWPGWLSSFLFFRLFDILKPSLIGWADKKNGSLGVMLDDIFAGIAAAICTILLAVVYHGI